jgi:hypothetical protein
MGLDEIVEFLGRFGNLEFQKRVERVGYKRKKERKVVGGTASRAKWRRRFYTLVYNIL